MAKPGRGASQCVPRPTHQWLAPLFTYLDKTVEGTTPSGASGIPNGAWLGRQVSTVQVGNATGIVGLYGFSGLAQIATGGAGILSATYLGASGFGATNLTASGWAVSGSGLAIFLGRFADNGGSGTPYTFSDAISALKRLGALPA